MAVGFEQRGEPLYTPEAVTGVAQRMLEETPLRPPFMLGTAYDRDGVAHLPVEFHTDALGPNMVIVGQAEANHGLPRHQVLLNALSNAIPNDPRLLLLTDVEDTGFVPPHEGVELMSITPEGGLNSVRSTYEEALEDLITVVFNSAQT